MTWPYDLHAEAVATFRCPYCDAPKGSRCMTRTGRPMHARWPHEDRVRPLRQAFYAGYEQAETDLIRHHAVMSVEQFDAMLSARASANLKRAASLVAETLRGR